MDQEIIIFILNMVIVGAFIMMVIVLLNGTYCIQPYRATGTNVSTGESFMEYDEEVCIKGFIKYTKYKKKVIDDAYLYLFNETPYNDNGSSLVI